MIVKDIPIRQIVLGENIRQVYREDSLASLMQTIKDNGLLQPIGVKEVSDGEYKILWGNRRLASCKKLDWKTVPAVIFSDKDSDMSEEQFLTINAIENLQQSPNTLFEIGRICKVLKKTMSISEIAVRLGISKNRVENSLTEISRIPVKWQKKIKIMDGNVNKEGFIPMSTAIKATRIRGLDKQDTDRLYNFLRTNDSSQRDIELIGSLIRNGSTLAESIKESKKFRSLTLAVYVDREKYEEFSKRYKNQAEMICKILNDLNPNMAIVDATKG